MPSTLPNALVWWSQISQTRVVARRKRFGSGLPSSDDLLLELRAELPGLDPPREVDLLRRVQQRDLPDLLEVHPDGIVGRRLEGVDLDADLRHGIGVVARKLDDLDALRVQVVRDLCEHVLDLIGRDLGQRLEEIARRDEATFAAEHDELLLDLIKALRIALGSRAALNSDLPAASGARPRVYGTRAAADPGVRAP